MAELTRIVILGGGVTGHAVAAFLSHALFNTGIRICLLELDSNRDGQKIEVESLAPTTQVFHENLGFNEADLLSATRGTFNLGYRFEDWLECGSDFVQGYNASGVNFGDIDFQNFYTKISSEMNFPAYDYFSLAALAAKKNRFAHPTNDQRSVLSTIEYGINLDSNRYANVLKKYSIENSVEFISGNFIAAELDEAGFIRHILLDTARIEGDFFIDCSGTSALLLGRTLGVKYTDWSAYCAANSTANYIQPHARNIPVTTTLKLLEGCWTKAVHLQPCSVNTVVFNNDVITPDKIQTLVDVEMTFSSLTPGYRRESWYKNVVGFGAAVANFEPLAFSGMDVLYKNLKSFLPLLPLDRRDCSLNAEEFNRQSAQTYERLRDYHLSHHLLAGGVAITPISIPDELAHRIELFRARGKVPRYDDEIIPADMWVSLFIGMGLMPQGYHPLVDAMDGPELREQIRRITQIMQQTADQLPSHDDYLNRYMQWKP